MGKKDPRVDAYIAKSADFAKPILTYLRSVVHEGCPEAAEDLKWGMPAFMLDGILCQMAAFTAHCGFMFWKGGLIVRAKDRKVGDEKGMGQFGRIAKLSDLPSKKTLLGYVKTAARLNDGTAARPKAAKPRAKKSAPLRTPVALLEALGRNRKAKAAFDEFPASHRKEYIEWIADAKADATRDRRVALAVLWMAEGKQRNWKYMKK